MIIATEEIYYCHCLPCGSNMIIEKSWIQEQKYYDYLQYQNMFVTIEINNSYYVVDF